MANLVHMLEGTSLTWTDAGGDNVFDIGGLASDAVRAGASDDLGAGARSEWYRYTLTIDGFDTDPVVDEAVNLYLSFSEDNTAFDGDLTSSDAASAKVVLPNLLFLNSAIVQTTTAANELIISGKVRILHRYVQPVIHNATADALLSSSDAHKFVLTPTPPQIQ